MTDREPIGEPIIVVGSKTLRRILERRGRGVFITAGLAALCLLVLLAVLLYPRTDGRVIAARRGDIIHSYVALGRVESERTLEIVPKIAARIEAVHVQEGDTVEAGQPLVTLESAPVRAQLDEASRGRDAAKARLDEIQRGTRSEDLDRARAALREAEQAQKSAEARLAEVLRGARPEEREAAEAQLALAASEAAHAAKEHERYQSLFEKGAVSERERDEAKRRHEAAQAQLRQAKARRDLVANGAAEEEKAQARAGAEAARARVEQETAVVARLAKGATEEERRSVEAELKKAEAVVARLEFELAQTQIAAPGRAVVARRYKEPSELAFPEMPQPILVLAASDERIVRAEVLETDIYKVRAGQPAAITSDSYPGRRWTGKVSRVAPAMGKKRLSTENPKEKTDVKVLEILITPDERIELPINLPAEVRVSEALRQGVVVLPVRAVGAGNAVRLPDGTRRTIQTGARDDAFVEVLSGLSEGERVLLPE